MKLALWNRELSFLVGLIVVSFAAVETVHAQRNEQPKVAVETVLSGLDNPCGIAVQPGTGQIYVSDSGLRVAKFDPAKPGESSDAVTGFPESTYGKGPVYKIGPLGLAFLNKNTLVVGEGGLDDGAELVRVFTLPEDGSSLTADSRLTVGPLPKSEETASGEGNFYAVAVNAERNAAYVTSNGDDDKGWLLKVAFKNGKPVSLESFIATKLATHLDAPVGITMHRSGYIVVGQMGEIDKPRDSLLTMYRPDDKKLIMNLKTELHDISALAYSATHHLYAADFAWMEPTEGGVFRLDASQEEGPQAVVAVRVATLDKPTAMVFGLDGALYVTVFGTAEEGSKEKPGSVVKITFEGPY